MRGGKGRPPKVVKLISETGPPRGKLKSGRVVVVRSKNKTLKTLINLHKPSKPSQTHTNPQKPSEAIFSYGFSYTGSENLRSKLFEGFEGF